MEDIVNHSESKLHDRRHPHQDFVSLSFDDHIKFMLDGDGDGDGPGAEPVRRDYTPRHHDAAARELTLEFALHGEGSAAQGAAQATVGQRAVIGGPRASFIIPLDCDWHLLVGDETALPAIHRRHGPPTAAWAWPFPFVPPGLTLFRVPRKRP